MLQPVLDIAAHSSRRNLGSNTSRSAEAVSSRTEETTARELHVRFTGTPGSLTSIFQCFSAIQISIVTLDFALTPDRDDGRARLIVTFAADARQTDLLVRKVNRLVEVVSTVEFEL